MESTFSRSLEVGSVLTAAGLLDYALERITAWVTANDAWLSSARVRLTTGVTERLEVADGIDDEIGDELGDGLDVLGLKFELGEGLDG